MQLMLDPAFLLNGTSQEYLWWFLVLIAVALLWVNVEKGNGLSMVIHLLVIAALVYLAMNAHPAHGQPYPRPRPEIAYPVPEPRPRPTFTWDHAMERCTQVCPAGPLRQECLYSCARRLTHPEWYGDK